VVTPGPIHKDFKVAGTVKFPSGLLVTLVPGTTSLDVSATGGVSGSLTLPTAVATFNLFGFIPLVANVQIIAGPVTGVVQSGVWTLSSTIKAKVTSLSVLGVLPLLPPGKTYTSNATTVLVKETAIGADSSMTLTGQVNLGFGNSDQIASFLTAATAGNGKVTVVLKK
jgi:hypothetical protein